MVDAQAEAIKTQAEAVVDGQAEAIKNQAAQQAGAKFDNGQYEAIKNQATQEITTKMDGLKGSLTSSADVQNLINGCGTCIGCSTVSG